MSGQLVRFPLQPRRILAEAAAALVVLVTVMMVGPARAEVPLDKTMKAVFTVHTADAEDRFLGSAFLWGAGDVAVTNAHVVGDAAEVRLTDATGNVEIAQVIERDVVRDVAVISVKPGRVGLIPLADVPRLGAEVWALGAPLGAAFSVTEGKISALARQVDAAVPIRMIQHDAAVNPGSSGGPLVDNRGALVGMNSQIADGSRMFVGIAYAISAADLAWIVPGLIEETLPPLPKLGMLALEVDRQLAQALGVAMGGVLVDRVRVGGLAEAAGLAAGDVVLAADGVALRGAGDLAFALESAQGVGATDLAIWRAGSMVVITVDLVVPEVAVLREVSGAALRVASYGLSDLGVTVDSALVVAVSDNSPALMAGLAVGDQIMKVNGRERVDLRSLQFAAPALLLVQGVDGATRHVMIDPWATGKTLRPVGGANVLDPDAEVF
jgi:serine protease Do